MNWHHSTIWPHLDVKKNSDNDERNYNINTNTALQICVIMAKPFFGTLRRSWERIKQLKSTNLLDSVKCKVSVWLKMIKLAWIKHYKYYTRIATLEIRNEILVGEICVVNS